MLSRVDFSIFFALQVISSSSRFRLLYLDYRYNKPSAICLIYSRSSSVHSIRIGNALGMDFTL
jgi:hypothetical protein